MSSIVVHLSWSSISYCPSFRVFAFEASLMPHAADKHRSTIGRLWGLLESLVSEAPDKGSNTKARALAMLKGAQKYLEAGHVKHIEMAIQSNRTQVTVDHIKTVR